MKNNKPINIAACGMDKQTSKLLEMVFNGPGRGNYALVEQLESAQACIFDLDSLEGMNLWKDYRNRYPQMPTVILSLNHKDIAGTVYVQKPIEIDNLLKALNKIKRLIEEESAPKSGAQKVSVKSASVKPQQAPRDAKLATEIAIEEEEEALHQYCGYAQDINPDNPQGFLKFYYEPNQYLQGFFEKAFVIGQQLDSGGIMIEGLYTKMILMPKQNQILCGCEFNDSQLRTMTLLPLSNSHLRMTTLSEAEIILSQDDNQLIEQPLDKFLWRVALWTSRGRVPKGTDLYKKIVLLYWPNFTRLIVTPYALKISALWMVQPHSLLETAKILEIPQRYVFALFTAARAIQLAFVDRRIERRVSQSISTSGAKRGIFQRLLARLRAPSS
ncbi:MAG TPA: hypothetical protein ENG03_11500 [Thioploca sp.]|nr:MAG: hypothetical protein B6247_20015 [Beggiatoa sp. 4572_84]RKZ63480.1 MAG: hypothetical protein DRR08_03405 [Gammaproteobacteria bacterium]HDN27696.1 hypothetical protein [Thioploca sp.]